MIVILSDDREQTISLTLRDHFLELNEVVCYHALEDKQIQSCLACGSCSSKTLGHCVLPDDMQPILKDLARADVWILISPIVFGSFSSRMKTAQERMSSLGDPLYYVNEGELVKGMRSKMHFYALGISSEDNRAEEEAFCRLHQENLKIMNCLGDTFILSSQPSEEELRRIVEVIQRVK